MVFNYRFSNHSELFERVVIAMHVRSIFFPHLNPCGTKRRHQRSRTCGNLWLHVAIVATCRPFRNLVRGRKVCLMQAPLVYSDPS